jgi:hypothetical protein
MMVIGGVVLKLCSRNPELRPIAPMESQHEEWEEGMVQKLSRPTSLPDTNRVRIRITERRDQFKVDLHICKSGMGEAEMQTKQWLRRGACQNHKDSYKH